MLEESLPGIGRREFIKEGAIAALGIVSPILISCTEKERPGVGDRLSRVTLSDLTGNNVVIPGDFSGKVVLLHFWASWCSSCRNEMTALESLHGKYREAGVIHCSIGI
ncbi:MAG: TlpA disulfide reductase family protein, partial [Syntrophales bacterium]|nr:TlpA disulfide reductase family protein [Syntrophales bacterium]